MPIAKGTAITREVSSATSAGLSQEISKAIEQNYGFDQDGNIQQVGGTSQVSTIPLKIRGTIVNIDQKHLLDFYDGFLATHLVGIANAITKIVSLDFTYRNTTAEFFTFTIGGETQQFSHAFTNGNIASLLAGQIASFNTKSKFTSQVVSITTNGSVVTVEFTVASGDSTFSITRNSNGASVGTTTVDRAFVASTPEQTLELEVSGTNTSGREVVFPNNGKSSIIYAAGVTIGWGEIVDQFTALLRSGEGVVSVLNSVSNSYLIDLAPGYEMDTLSMKFSRTDSATSVISTHTQASTINVVRVVAQPESYGPLLITVKNPFDDANYTVAVNIPQDETDEDISDLFTRSFAATPAGFDQAGEQLYLSHFIVPSVGDVTVGTDSSGRATHNFTVTLTWTVPGIAGTPVVDMSNVVDASSDTPTVATPTTGANIAPDDRIDWFGANGSITTSSVLQPGGAITHFATLVYLQA